MTDSQPEGTDPHGTGLPPSQVEAVSRDLRRADYLDAVRELQLAERKSARHLTWAALGVSPAALIALVGLLMEGSYQLVWPLFVLVGLVEGTRHLLAEREVRRLSELVRKLRSPQSREIDEESRDS